MEEYNERISKSNTTKDFENNLMSLACNIMLFEVRKEIDKQLKNKIL